MSKDSRSGGKFTGNHTTMIPLAGIVCDGLIPYSFVTKITPGFIKAGLKSVGGQKRIKITEKVGSILLSIRDNTSHQEVYVYTGSIQATKLVIIKWAKNKRVKISFEKK